jgi:hypothetical protein
MKRSHGFALWLGLAFLCVSRVAGADAECASHGTPATTAAAEAAATAQAQVQVPAELKAEVPELTELHEVIYPLWHGAWPEKNYAQMKELLPQVKKDVAAVEAAKLPGILRDKQDDWDAGVKKLTAATTSYEAAVAANDEKAMLDSVEALHGEFESLIRLVRPRSAELEAYHVVLYQIYHHHGPEQQLEALRPATVELGAKCEELSKADAPRRIAGDEAKVKQYTAGVADLCAKTQELMKTAAGDDWKAISQAIETVHTQYQAVERLIG